LGSKGCFNLLEYTDILRDIPVAIILACGGQAYLDVQADVGPIAHLPPLTATHVLLGAGLQAENVLKLAIVAKMDEIFDPRDLNQSTLEKKPKKVKNYFVSYSTSNGKPIRLSEKPDGDHCLSIYTNWSGGNLTRCGANTRSNTHDFGKKYRIFFCYF